MFRPLLSRRLATATILSAIVLGTVPGAAMGAKPADSGRALEPGLFVPDASLYEASQLAKSHGGLGAYRDIATRRVVIVTPEAAAANFAPASISSLGDPVDVRLSKFERSSIAAIESDVDALQPSLKSGQAFLSGYDISHDQFTIVSNVPERLFAGVEAKYRGKVAYTYNNDLRRTSRHDDSSPHWGGAELYRNNAFQCTAGYTISIGSTRYMVTAGHCYPIGVGEWVTGGTGLPWGTIRLRSDFPNTDVELIGGQSYGGYIYTSYSGALQVRGYTRSLVGTSPYCVSGAVTPTHCTYTETADGLSWTDTWGRTTGLTKLSGYGVQRGDSGGPAYITCSGYVCISGSVVATSVIGGWVLIEPWYERVRPLYGSSIVSG